MIRRQNGEIRKYEYFLDDNNFVKMYENIIFFFKQKTAYEMRISDWSSDVCSSDLPSNWLAALRAARGIYLLTCPRTKEQYVGSDVLPKALPVITGVRGWYGAPRGGVAQPAWQHRRASARQHHYAAAHGCSRRARAAAPSGHGR